MSIAYYLTHGSVIHWGIGAWSWGQTQELSIERSRGLSLPATFVTMQTSMRVWESTISCRQLTLLSWSFVLYTFVYFLRRQTYVYKVNNNVYNLLIPWTRYSLSSLKHFESWEITTDEWQCCHHKIQVHLLELSRSTSPNHCWRTDCQTLCLPPGGTRMWPSLANERQRKCLYFRVQWPTTCSNRPFAFTRAYVCGAHA